MRSQMDFDVLSNWVSMLRAEIDGAILLSNEDSEGRFYEKCVHPSSRVVPSPGVACQLLTHVKQRGIDGLVATIRVSDAKDGCHLDDIFWPGLGDVASLLLVSESSERIIEELTGTPWFKSAEKEVGSLRDRAISISWIFEKMLQFISIQSHPFSIEDFIDWKEFDFSDSAAKSNFGDDAVIRIQALRTRLPRVSLQEKIRECNGMNAVKVLARATKMFRPRGLVAHQISEVDYILQMLRVAYDFAEFENDTMFWQMRRWERHNPKFPLLRLWRILDPLMVVQDQRYWEKDLRLMIQMDSTGEGISAFKMDLDNFKAVNEHLGHTAGDEALRLYCKIVQEILKQTAEVYRRGGDEVVALAPGVPGQVAFELAEKIREKIEAEFLKWGNERGLSQCPTASIGVVDVEPGCVHENIIQVLDQSQAKAKAEGKNRVVMMHCKSNGEACVRV